jgi:hypothetical protein
MARHAILIGYNGPTRQPDEKLSYAESDIVERLLPWLREHPAWRRDADIAVCGPATAPTDSGIRVIDATHLVPELERVIRQARQDDFVFVYFAGHAVVRPIDGVETECIELPNVWLPLDQFRRISRQNVNGCAVFLVLDCCYPLVRRDRAGRVVEFRRIVSKLGSVIPETDLQFIRSRNLGMVEVLGACLPGQEANESPLEGGGFFASAFIRACEGSGRTPPATDARCPGVVTTASIVAMIEQDLRGWQRPALSSADPFGLRLREINAGPKVPWQGAGQPPMLGNDKPGKIGRRLLADSAFSAEHGQTYSWSTAQFPEVQDRLVYSSASILPPFGSRATLAVGFEDKLITCMESCPACRDPGSYVEQARYITDPRVDEVEGGAYAVALAEHEKQQYMVLSRGEAEPELYLYKHPDKAILDPRPARLGPGTECVLHPLYGRAFAQDTSGSLRIWPTENPESTPPVVWPGHHVSRLSVSGHYAAVATADDNVYIWDFPAEWTPQANFRPIPAPPNGYGSVQDVILSSERAESTGTQDVCVVAGYGFGDLAPGAVFLWRASGAPAREWDQVRTLAIDERPVSALAFSEGAERLASAAGTVVHMWKSTKEGGYGRRAATIDITQRLALGERPTGAPALAVTCMAFSPRVFAAPVLIMGTNYGHVILWEYRRGQLSIVPVGTDGTIISDVSVLAWNRYEARLMFRTAKKAEIWYLIAKRVQ